MIDGQINFISTSVVVSPGWYEVVQIFLVVLAAFKYVYYAHQMTNALSSITTSPLTMMVLFWSRFTRPGNIVLVHFHLARNVESVFDVLDKV